MHIYKHKQTNLDNDDKAKRWQIVLGQYCVSHPSLSKSFIHTVSIVFVVWGRYSLTFLVLIFKYLNNRNYSKNLYGWFLALSHNLIRNQRHFRVWKYFLKAKNQT